MSFDTGKIVVDNAQMLHSPIASGASLIVQSPLLTEQELAQLAGGNATEQPYALDLCVQDLVARCAASTPDAVALVAGAERCSYRELNARANQLAHYLRSLGIQPGALVGCCFERSISMVVALLAVLKAGAAYLPLDPAYPTERLAFMLADAQVSVILTQNDLSTRLTSANTTVIRVDADAHTLTQQPTTDPTPLAHHIDLAYVIYTSGSTGQPKGVQISHASLLNLVFWHQRAFAVTPADRATQLASPAFDAAVWELWPYLSAGASIYLPDEETRVSPLRLRDWLLDNTITITFLPTVLAESVIALDWPSRTPLRYLLTGADMLHHYPAPSLPFAFVNNYGPTEATVVTTSGIVPATARPDGPPPLGRPIDNMQLYILDEQLQQVPPGTIGELYIGGASLAQGYLNRPELTAERFIPHPFSDDPQARLYKTGDLAYFLADGQLAFVGRADQQIKIRGYRIEPNEIVAALASFPAVQASTVMAREASAESPGEKRLVAYLVLQPDTHVTIGALREHLQERLPDYMIPSAFVLLDELPVTPNGKVNQSTLPAPDASNMLHDGAITAPATPLEERIERIVASLLGMTQVGIDDNFFMLGGHSLLGTQLIVRVADTFGVDLTLRSLFNAPTVRMLADEVERLVLAKIESLSEDEIRQLLA